MQLNIHVPKERESIVADLEDAVAASGKPKNQIVLDALAAHLKSRRSSKGGKPRLRTWKLGAAAEIRRVDLYEERAEAKHGRRSR